MRAPIHQHDLLEQEAAFAPEQLQTARAALLACDHDRLARHLGLTNAAAVAALLESPQALDRLSRCLAVGVADLSDHQAGELLTTWLAGPGDG